MNSRIENVIIMGAAGRDFHNFNCLFRDNEKVDVVAFTGHKSLLGPTGVGGMYVRDGIEIRALVRADYYPASGRFQVIVDDIDPSFTLGKLALTREQILRELVEGHGGRITKHTGDGITAVFKTAGQPLARAPDLCR